MSVPHKLSKAQVIRLMNDVARGDMTQMQLAERYKVSRTTIQRYVKRIRSDDEDKVVRELKPCGTPAAYQRHLHNNEIPCRPCMDAEAEKKRKQTAARAAGKPKHVPPPCGTVQAYWRHKKRKQVACQPCLDALAKHRMNKKKEKAA